MRLVRHTLAALVIGLGASAVAGAAVAFLFSPHLPGPERPTVATTPAAGGGVRQPLASRGAPRQPDATPTAELAAAPPVAILAPVAPATGTAPVAPAAPPTIAPAPPRPVSETPADAVRTFYRLVAGKQFGLAEQLWTRHMRAVFPPAENITQRFAQTQQLTVEDVQVLLLDEAAGRARVSVAVLERLASGGTRHYRGTWELVRADQAWFLDQPDLRLE